MSLCVPLWFLIFSVSAFSAEKHAPSKKPSPKPPERKTIRIHAVGDIMMGTVYPAAALPPDDGAHLFDRVRGDLAGADIVFGNLEGVLADSGTAVKTCQDMSKCFLFRTPARYARYLKDAGFNVMSIANNHSRDFGDAGIAATVAALKAQGVRYSGPPGVNAVFDLCGEEKKAPGAQTAGPKAIIVSFATTNGFNDLTKEGEAAEIIRRLKKDNPVVIVSFHGGAEGSAMNHVPEGREFFLGEDRGDLRKFTHRLVDAGADLLIGHGPHVLRGMEIYKDRLIVYSLGNFLTGEGIKVNGRNGFTVVLHAEIDSDGRFLRGALKPYRQTREQGLFPDPAGEALKEIISLTQSDFPASGPRITETGEISPQ